EDLIGPATQHQAPRRGQSLDHGPAEDVVEVPLLPAPGLEATAGVLVGVSGRLDHAVQGDELAHDQLAHLVLLKAPTGGPERGWLPSPIPATPGRPTTVLGVSSKYRIWRRPRGRGIGAQHRAVTDLERPWHRRSVGIGH